MQMWTNAREPPVGEVRPVEVFWKARHVTHLLV